MQASWGFLSYPIIYTHPSSLHDRHPLQFIYPVFMRHECFRERENLLAELSSISRTPNSLVRIQWPFLRVELQRLSIPPGPITSLEPPLKSPLSLLCGLKSDGFVSVSFCLLELEVSSATRLTHLFVHFQEVLASLSIVYDYSSCRW